MASSSTSSSVQSSSTSSSDFVSPFTASTSGSLASSSSEPPKSVSLISPLPRKSPKSSPPSGVRETSAQALSALQQSVTPSSNVVPPAQPAPLGRKPSGPPVQSRVAWSEDAPAPAPAPAPVVVHGRKQLNRHSVVQVAPEKPDSAAPDTRSKPVDPSTIPTTGTPRRRASSVEERQTEAAQQMKQQEARKVRDAALKQKRAPVNKKTETE